MLLCYLGPFPFTTSLSHRGQTHGTRISKGDHPFLLSFEMAVPLTSSSKHTQSKMDAFLSVLLVFLVFVSGGVGGDFITGKYMVFFTILFSASPQ
jgi:hypothetical protein